MGRNESKISWGVPGKETWRLSIVKTRTEGSMRAIESHFGGFLLYEIETGMDFFGTLCRLKGYLRADIGPRSFKLLRKIFFTPRQWKPTNPPHSTMKGFEFMEINSGLYREGSGQRRVIFHGLFRCRQTAQPGGLNAWNKYLWV